MSGDQRKLSDFEFLIDTYRKNNYDTVDLYLTDVLRFSIQLNDVYYYSRTDDPSFDLTQKDPNFDINTMFFFKEFNHETNEYEIVFDRELFDREKHNIKKIPATYIGFLDDGLSIDNYDYAHGGIDIENNIAYHSINRNRYIPFSSIVYMEPGGYWKKVTTIIRDNYLIERCKELF